MSGKLLKVENYRDGFIDGVTIAGCAQVGKTKTILGLVDLLLGKEIDVVWDSAGKILRRMAGSQDLTVFLKSLDKETRREVDLEVEKDMRGLLGRVGSSGPFVIIDGRTTSYQAMKINARVLKFGMNCAPKIIAARTDVSVDTIVSRNEIDLKNLQEILPEIEDWNTLCGLIGSKGCNDKVIDTGTMSIDEQINLAWGYMQEKYSYLR